MFQGPKQWQAIRIEGDNATYRWSDGSTYVKNPPYFEGITMEPKPVGDIHKALSDAKADGRHDVLIGAKTSQATKFVALPIG